MLGLRCCTGFLPSRRVGFSSWGLLLWWSTGPRVCGLQQRRHVAQQAQLAGSRAQAQKLWHTGSVASWPMGSSWIRDRTHVSCIGRQILNHWANREALPAHFFKKFGKRGPKTTLRNETSCNTCAGSQTKTFIFLGGKKGKRGCIIGSSFLKRSSHLKSTSQAQNSRYHGLAQGSGVQ